MKLQKRNITQRNKIDMKYILKIILLNIIIVFLDSCKKTDIITENTPIKKDSTNKNIEKKDSLISFKIKQETIEENENDEYISQTLFAKWKGHYELRQSDLIDGWGRESTSISELDLIKPDSCIFKSWLADANGKRYNKNDNYQEIIGSIYATTHKDSVEFYTKRIIAGSDNSFSPFLSLVRNNLDYSIYSFFTSPPHNGIIKMPINKTK